MKHTQERSMMGGRGGRFARFFVRRLASAYFSLEIRGLEYIPHQGGAIIAGNHPKCA